MILITCAIKNDAKFYTQIFSEEALHNEYAYEKDKQRISASYFLEDEKKEVEPIFADM